MDQPDGCQEGPFINRPSGWVHSFFGISEDLSLRERCMREICTCSVRGGRRPARKRASSDPTIRFLLACPSPAREDPGQLLTDNLDLPPELRSSSFDSTNIRLDTPTYGLRCGDLPPYFSSHFSSSRTLILPCQGFASSKCPSLGKISKVLGMPRAVRARSSK